jgi:EAL domain-containing protein (putative c-di-GMP-specific phosphodiesterase class I)
MERMSGFENVIKIDPSREEGSGYEKIVRIEKPDHEYYAPGFIHPIPTEKEKKVIEHIHQINLREANEKSKSKTTKRKTAKNDPKLHRPTMDKKNYNKGLV